MGPLRVVRQLAGQLQNTLSAASKTSAPPPPGVQFVRDVLAVGSSKNKLVKAVGLQIDRGLNLQFRRYVEWLERQGYTFGSCEDWPLRLDTRRAYLRYDVHVRDILGAFALAHLHEEHQIPGSFQVCWEHSRAEFEAADLFLKLRMFDTRFVQFGLHCSPESSWLVAEECCGRSECLEQFVANGEVSAMMVKWLAAFERAGDEAEMLVAARTGAEARFREVATSFRHHFGASKTVSAHGTSLAAAYLDALRAEPRLAVLGRYFHPVEFLTEDRIVRHGFAGELTRFDEDALPGPRIMFENPICEMAARYRERLSGGGGFVALFHPASWTADHFRPFLEVVTASDW